jgi:hypothetical protein
MISSYGRLTRQQQLAWWAMGISVVLLVGCSGGGGAAKGRQQTYPAKGKVTYNGAPVANAQVAFLPEDDGMPPAIGVTASDGSFKLTTYSQNDGAVVGTHQVKVTSMEQDTKPPVEVDFDDPESLARAQAERFRQGVSTPLKEPKSLIPEKYSKFGTSGLIARVTEGSDNEFTFELTD